MQVIDDIKDFEKPNLSIVTIGTFDGVHVGHQAILKELVHQSEISGGKSILITFWPHPRFILKKDDSSLKLLSTFEEKVELLEEIGIDYIIKIPFTPAFSNLSAENFVQEILVNRIGTSKLYIGYDHRFGNNREGDIDFLRKQALEHNFEVNEIPRQDIDDIGVSSTKIRNYLHDGKVQLANTLLNRKYSIKGKVVDGAKRGREIGFPTANVALSESYKLLPADGAYAVKCIVEGAEHKGMLNIGFKPTVEGTNRTIEAHLFNFEEDIYGREITIEFVRSLRKELKFSSLAELREQLTKDKNEAIQILK